MPAIRLPTGRSDFIQWINRKIPTLRVAVRNTSFYHDFFPWGWSRFLYLTMLLFCSCQNDIERGDEFYLQNKARGKALRMFSRLTVSPFRSYHSVSFDSVSLRLIVEIKGDSVAIVNKDSDIEFFIEHSTATQEEFNQDLKKIMDEYFNLKVQTIVGMKYLIKFIITPELGIVYVPEPHSLPKDFEKLIGSEKQQFALRIYDEYWYSYKIEPPYELNQY